MAQIELDALETLDVQAWRTEDGDGEVTLIVKTDDGIVRIRVGRTADDADRLAAALGKGADQALKVGEEWDDRPDEHDMWVSLDRYRYWVSWDGLDQPGHPRHGYPSRDIAIYEAAEWQAAQGHFPATWITGEHGPAAASIDEEIRAHHYEGGSAMKALAGVVYEPGDEVWYRGSVYEVVRDYGGEIGVWLQIPVDPSAGDDPVAEHGQLSLALDEGDPIEFRYGASWVPGTFARYQDTDRKADSHAMVRNADSQPVGNIPLRSIRKRGYRLPGEDD